MCVRVGEWVGIWAGQPGCMGHTYFWNGCFLPVLCRQKYHRSYVIVVKPGSPGFEYKERAIFLFLLVDSLYNVVISKQRRYT